MASYLGNREYELISAMQKFIRRSMEREAGRAFFELATSGGTFRIALNRLKVIAHEDVGMGDPDSALYALRCIDDAADWHSRGNDAWRLAAANAILALARARGSRVAEHFQAAVRGQNAQEGGVVVPDYALDMHTRRGKKMGRGLEHFFTEAAKMEPSDLDPTYQEEAQEVDRSGILNRPKANNRDSQDGGPSLF